METAMARRFYKNEDPGVVLPITAFLDMSFQLLAFFIFTYHPSDLEGQMEMNLPEKQEAKADTPPDAPVPNDADPPPIVEADISVILRTQHDGRHDGDIKMISISEGPNETTVESVEALQKQLAEKRKTLTNKEGVKIQGDGRLKWAKIVEIMDICRKAGFRDVSFAPPPDFVPGT
jgi:biopolymer transport protein ExbD